MSSKLHVFNDNNQAEATPCTFQEFKENCGVESNQYNDLERGYIVRLLDTGRSGNTMFVPFYVWNIIAEPY